MARDKELQPEVRNDEQAIEKATSECAERNHQVQCCPSRFKRSFNDM